eukprot:gene18376-25887_t
MDEYWTTVKGNKNYAVSTFGNVENMLTGRILKTRINCNGYIYVDLHKNGKRKTRTIHQLVAEAFLHNPDEKLCVDHIDNDRQNNNISNLRYASVQENARNSKLSSKNTSGIKGMELKSI